MDTADRVTTDVSLLFLAFLANPLQLQLRIYASRTDLTDGEIGKRSTNIRYRRPEMQENNIVQPRFLVVLSSPREYDCERLFASVSRDTHFP